MANSGNPRSTLKQERVERPAGALAEPAEVVADPRLSTGDKLTALNTLEQDARQLAVAAAEGMSGGEETNLREVLQAKRAFEQPSTEAALAVVTRALEEKLRKTLGTDAHEAISRALNSIKEAREAIEAMESAPTPPPGAPKPGSTEELDEELAKEKLDP